MAFCNADMCLISKDLAKCTKSVSITSGQYEDRTHDLGVISTTL